MTISNSELAESIQTLITTLQGLGDDLSDYPALSVAGRASNSEGSIAAISAGGNGFLLGTDGDEVKFTKLTGSMIPNDIVNNDMLRNSAAVSVIGRSANSTGDPADIAAGSNGMILGRLSNALAFDTPANYGLVTLSGSQTISGEKTFTAKTVFSNAGFGSIRNNPTGISTIGNDNHATRLQIVDTGASGSASIIGGRFTNDTAAPTSYFLKSRSGTVGGNAAVQSDDILGRLIWAADTGSAYNANMAEIRATARTRGAGIGGELGFLLRDVLTGGNATVALLLGRYDADNQTTFLRLTGYTNPTITRTMTGIELLGINGLSSGDYFSAIKWMATDAELTTDTPRLAALITARATQTYNDDNDGGAAVEIFANPVDPGSTSVPVLVASFQPASIDFTSTAWTWNTLAITIGDNDSGGAGFRCLRVPNSA